MYPRKVGLIEREPLLKGLRIGKGGEILISLISRSLSDLVISGRGSSSSGGGSYRVSAHNRPHSATILSNILIGELVRLAVVAVVVGEVLHHAGVR